VMGAKQAVTIVRRRDIAASEDPAAARDAYAEEYRDEHLTAAVAAAEGYIDEIVQPSDTRRRLGEALRTLEGVAHPAHGVKNIPL
jgi:propionyl-CoA carboxylase beta chain